MGGGEYGRWQMSKRRKTIYTSWSIAPKIQKFEMQILQPEHIKEYLNAANARELLPMFYLELVSGLRKGELVALLSAFLQQKSTENRSFRCFLELVG